MIKPSIIKSKYTSALSLKALWKSKEVYKMSLVTDHQALEEG